MIEDKDNLLELPDGWIWTNFDQIAENNKHALKAGPFGSALKKEFYVSEGYKIYGQEQVIRGDPFYGDYYIDEERYEALKSCAVKPGDILISLVGTIGKVLVLPSGIEPGIINPRLVKLSLEKKLINTDYIKAYLESSVVRNYLSRLSHGGTMDILNLTILKALPITLPPLNEQHRIVAKIEALKARSARVKESLSTIPALLDQFRQSVLAAAFRGDLTAEWRSQNSNVEPAYQIVDNIFSKRKSKATTTAQIQKLHEIYSYEEESSLLPDTWKYVTLEKLCDSFQYGTSTKSIGLGKVAVLRMGNLQNGEIKWDDLVYTSDDNEIEKYKLKPGDVLFNRTNSPELVGKTSIYRGEYPAIYAGYLIKINNYIELDSEYLNYCLNTTYAKNYCWRVKTDGVSQSNINAQKLGKFEIPLCSIDEQKEIVRRVKALLHTSKIISQQYQQTKDDINQLDQSILSQAFSGNLVPQDPNDEPASVLLQHIRTQREKTLTPKTKRTKKTNPVSQPTQMELEL